VIQVETRPPSQRYQFIPVADPRVEFEIVPNRGVDLFRRGVVNDCRCDEGQGEKWQGMHELRLATQAA
jgi:hypothetical protein